MVPALSLAIAMPQCDLWTECFVKEVGGKREAVPHLKFEFQILECGVNRDCSIESVVGSDMYFGNLRVFIAHRNPRRFDTDWVGRGTGNREVMSVEGERGFQRISWFG